MAQHIPKGRPHRNEQAAILHLAEKLPATFGVFSNLELPIPGRPGQTYEHDVIVVSQHMVFAVELKAWGGPIQAGRDRWILDDGTVRTSPIPLQQSKARVLKGALAGRHHLLQGRNLWVQGVVFLTKRDAEPVVEPGLEPLVCTYADVIQRLSDPNYWGQHDRLTKKQLQEISHYLHGGDPRRVGHRFNGFKLNERLTTHDDAPYESWRGERLGQPRTLHVYPLKERTEQDNRRMRDRALREVALQERLRNGPNLLAYYDLDKIVDGPEHAYILNFEDVGSLLPLMQWVRQHNPTLEARLDVARRVAIALRFMHSKRIVHRRLSPDAVLVSNEPFPQQVKLHAMELARDLSQQIGTVSPSLLEQPTSRYMAPEQLVGGLCTERSDLFALGAILFELFNGRPLFDKPEDTLRPYTVPPLHTGSEPVPHGVALTNTGLLDRDATSRPDLDALLEELTSLRAPPVTKPAVQSLEPGAELSHYTLDKPLREGPVAVWLAEHRLDASRVVLKIGPAGDENIQREVDALKHLHHPNVVRYRDYCPTNDDRVMLVVDAVDGIDGALHAGAGDPIDADGIATIGHGLFAALGALHAQGRLHRDVKPENVLLTDGTLQPVLIDFGLATPLSDPGQLIPGTPQYKDPWLYERGSWEIRDDLFSAWVTLYEIATGVHPFGGHPTLDSPPTVSSGDLADEVDPDIADRLVALFQRTLGPPEDRPADAAEASAALETALHQAEERSTVPAPLVAPTVQLKPGVQPETPIESLGFGVRAFRALTTLGVREAVQVQRVTPGMLRELRNVGRKTVAEIMAVKGALNATLGGFNELEPTPEVAVKRPPAPMAPGLVQDTRPLIELGPALTPKLREHFEEMGVATVGELAALPASLLQELQGVGPKRVDALHEALGRLSGQASAPTDLAGLDALLRDELGKRYDCLSALFGLEDGVARTYDEAATHLDLSRQRVHQAVDLDELRRDASAGRFLVETMETALPSCGFAPLPAAAEMLETHLPSREGGPSALGYARLAAMLLRPAPESYQAAHAHQALTFVFRPPWQRDFIVSLQQQLTELVSQEPVPYADAQAELLRAAGELGMTGALQRFGADGASLLDALLSLDPEIQRTTRDECLYLPPIAFADALIYLADQVTLPTTPRELRDRVAETFHGDLQVTDDELAEALALMEWRQYPDGYIAGPDYTPLPPVDEVHTDVTLPEVRATDDGTLDLGLLVPATKTGGFRVVALPPSTHHRQCEAVASSLKGRLVDIDRILIDALRDSGMWDDALFFEGDDEPDFSWAHDDLVAALEAALAEASPGQVTVLGRPCLLGPLGLTYWVSGLYERARGGRLGLVLFAPPADIEDGRVKLNQRYPLPYTPDMAAPVVRAEPLSANAPSQEALL